MSGELLGLGLFFGMFILLLFSILLIAFFAIKARKKRQKDLLELLPEGVDVYAFVRYNTSELKPKILKMSIFEGGALLYTKGTRLVLKNKKGFSREFDIQNSELYWEGETSVNKLIRWFSISDAKGKLYLNVDSEMLVFPSKKKYHANTLSIYEHLSKMKHQMR